MIINDLCASGSQKFGILTIPMIGADSEDMYLMAQMRQMANQVIGSRPDLVRYVGDDVSNSHEHVFRSLRRLVRPPPTCMVVLGYQSLRLLFAAQPQTSCVSSFRISTRPSSADRHSQRSVSVPPRAPNSTKW